VPSRRLEDRIRELCALAIATNTADFAEVLAELRSALHQHSEQLRKLARTEFASAKGMADSERWRQSHDPQSKPATASSTAGCGNRS
jgi:hypothetical protein